MMEETRRGMFDVDADCCCEGAIATEPDHDDGEAQRSSDYIDGITSSN